MKDRISTIEKMCRGKTVLNLGCVGAAQFPMDSDESLHSRLKKVAKNVVGVDMQKTEFGKPDVVANVENLNLGKKFDVVVAGEIIEHVNNPGKLLHSAKKHMRDDSILILTTPNMFSTSVLIEYLLRREKQFSDDHVAWFSEKTLSTLMKRHGYEIIEIKKLLDIKLIKPNLFGRFVNFIAAICGCGDCLLFVAKINK